MPPYKFKDISVLVIESSEPAFAIARDVLATFGITQVYPVFDIQKAFDIFKSHSPDVIFVGALDDFNAVLAFTKRIRFDRSSPDPLAPVILMMGAPSRGQVFTARDAGVSEFLSKPYSANSLYQKMESVIERPGTFVKAEDYFGPDRRRKAEDAFSGENRRQKTPLIVDAKQARTLLKAHFQSKNPADDDDDNDDDE